MTFVRTQLISTYFLCRDIITSLFLLFFLICSCKVGTPWLPAASAQSSWLCQLCQQRFVFVLLPVFFRFPVLWTCSSLKVAHTSASCSIPVLSSRPGPLNQSVHSELGQILHPPVHHDGWMENDQDTVFCYVTVPQVIMVVSLLAFFCYLPKLTTRLLVVSRSVISKTLTCV